jgi:tetratricopeptide (TPR) repeat protein
MMFKKTLLFTLFLLNGSFSLPGIAQANSTSPQDYKLSWQRLLLQLSSTYFNVVKENQVNLDSSLIYASSSLGLSRLSIIAEGIDDEELLAHAQWVDKREPFQGVLQLSGLKGIKRLKLLVLLGAYYAFEPDNYHRYKDSVLYFLHQAIYESKKEGAGNIERLALCLLGKMYVGANDLQQGAVIFDKLTKQNEEAKDLSCEARALAWRGIYTAFLPANTQDRINYLQRSIDLYRSQHNSEQVVNLLTDIGYLHISNFNLKDAPPFLLEAVNLEDSIGFPAKHYNYDVLALIGIWESKFGEPLKYTLEEVKISETIRDSIGWGYFYNRLGTLYKMVGDKDEEAMKWILKALDRFTMGKGDPGVYLSIDALSGLRFKNEQLSLKILKKILEIGKKMPPENPVDHLFYHQALTNCYFDLKQYDLVETNLIEADRFEKQLAVLSGGVLIRFIPGMASGRN